jgi:hypothetical protein
MLGARRAEAAQHRRLAPVCQLAFRWCGSARGDPRRHGAVAPWVEIALLMPVAASDPESARRCRPLARAIVLDLIGEEDLATCVIDVEVFPLSVLQPNSSTLSLGQLVSEFDRLVGT